MINIVKSLLVIFFLIGFVLYATFFSSTIKEFWATKTVINGKSVLGISVSSSSATTDGFKQEAKLGFENISNQISQIKIGDIIKSINNGGRLIHDLSYWGRTVQTDIQQISGQKK